MPGRVARQTTAAPKSRVQRKKSEKKALNAFSIAAHSIKTSKKHQVPKHRLGEIEPDNSVPKRRRTDEDDGDDQGGETQSTKRRKAGDDGLEYGSDGDGNEWHTGGAMDDENDSEIDSDEAFGESDEERFEGFTFRGSHSHENRAANKNKRSKRPFADDDGDVDIEEDGSGSDEEDEDGLGADAVDLATMLDDDHASDVSTSADEPGTESGEGEDPVSESDTSPSDAESDDADPEKLANLQDLVASLETSLGEKQRGTDSHEAQTPSAFGLTASQKLRVTDLLPTVKDPALRKSLKVLASEKPSKRAGIPAKLEAPLPKRQQDRLDRAAATQKAKETLERWRDTVIRNRRAEHLQFPLVDPDAQEPMGTKRMVAVQNDKPQTELEAAIQEILEASGLSENRNNGADDEKTLREAETLQTNKLPVEEVMARRAELRRARELLFREEVRAKRVKKIKSRSYRRVHRRERERQKEMDGAFMDPDGEGLGEDEKERQDRRRAEARMGAKHRESRWAKNMKQSGRTVWDDDAREGIIDMARRNEELRKRIEGKDVDDHDNSSEDYHSSDESDDDDVDADPSTGDRKRLARQVDRLAADDVDKASSRLGGMAFMQRADAARKRQNDATIEEIRRELAEHDGDDPDQEQPDLQLGRRIFGPAPGEAKPSRPVARPEMEERLGSDDEDVDVVVEKPAVEQPGPRSRTAHDKTASRQGLSRPQAAGNTQDEDGDDDPWLTAATGNKKSKQSSGTEFVPTVSSQPEKRTSSTEFVPTVTSQSEKKKSTGTAAVRHPSTKPTGGDDEEHETEPEPGEGMLSARDEQAMYHARAFAGDDAGIETAFEAEKKAQTAEQDDQIISDALPGWGSWTGQGLSKAEKKSNAAKRAYREKHDPLMKSRVEGTRPEHRRDAKLKNVIISEARERKGRKYLASQLPHEFERKAQYERSLRIPIGKEWTTKETFQKHTKPRVTVKQGVIAPMSKPMV